MTTLASGTQGTVRSNAKIVTRDTSSRIILEAVNILSLVHVADPDLTDQFIEDNLLLHLLFLLLSIVHYARFYRITKNGRLSEPTIGRK